MRRPWRRDQRRIPGRDVGEFRRGASAEVQGGEAPRRARIMAGTDQQAPDLDRHRAEQRTEGRPGVALAGRHLPAGRAPPAALAHGRHLCRHDLGLERRREPLRLVEPEPEVGQAGLLVALDPCDLGLGRHAGLRLRDQLDPPHQLRHQPPLPREPGAYRSGDPGTCPQRFACSPQQSQQRLVVRLELLQRVARQARDHPGHQPVGLAHLDDRDQRAVLVQGDEGPAQVVRPWHGASPSACVQRRWCSTPGAAP